MLLKFNIIAILFLLANILNAQTADVLIIEHADSLVGSATEPNPFRIYEGNVSFINGDIKVKCDKAFHYFSQNLAILEGRVKIIQNKLELTAPYVVYNGNSKIAYAKKHVEIIDGSTFLSADSGSYNTNTRDAYFFGSVFIEDDSAVIYTDYLHHNRLSEVSHAFGKSLIQGKFTNALIYSDSISNYAQENYTLARGNPILVQIDTLKNKEEDIEFDTLTVVSLKMEAFRNKNDESYFFTDSVEIFKNDILTKSGNTHYRKDAGIIRLTENPVVWYDSTQIKADSIVILIRNNNLQRIKTFNNAIAMVKNDTVLTDRINQISGDSLFIDFEKSKPNRITAYNDAKSLYFLIEENEGSGAERKNTDKVVVEFEDGEIRFIHWVGTTTGEYYPEIMINNEPERYNLPLFKWRTDKPEKQNLDFLYK